MSAPSKREVVKQALHVTGWMLKAIEAPKDLQYWPRRDRDAWMDVVGRPRLREVMARLQAANTVTTIDEAGEDMTGVVNALRAEAGLDYHAIVDVGDAPPAWHHVEARDAYETVIEVLP